MGKWFYYGISNGVGVLFTVVFLFVSKNADYSIKCKPLKFSFILLITLEILKIGYQTNELGLKSKP